MRATAVSILILGFSCLAMAQGPEAPNRKVGVARKIEQQFAQTVRPFVEKYCVTCHTGDSAPAQFDLASYATVAFRKVLGEVVPPPPPVVPELPGDEATSDLPIRDMLIRHRANPACASCHSKFDSFGLAFEGYGPIGEVRTKDLAGRLIDAVASFPGESQGEGLKGIQKFIRDNRQTEYTENLSRKLLAYGLNRSLQLSDEPFIEALQPKWKAANYAFPR